MDYVDAYWPHVAAVAGFAAATVATLHVLLEKDEPRAAAVWVGLIWLVPAFGPLLYVIAGINRMPRRAARRAVIARETAVLERFVIDGGAPWAGQPLVAGNRVTPLYGGDVAYPAMLQAIGAATDSVVMCSYIFDNDRAGALFRDALAAAVRRGVEVRVLVDAVGARYSFPSVVGSLRRSGVRVARFSRSLVPWRWVYANLRNHRKLCVIDGAVGFCGGMNIREQCMLGLDPPPQGPTLDLHFRIDGPAVAELQRTLAEDWEFCTRESLEGARFFPALDAAGETMVRAIADGPDRRHSPIKWAKLAAVARARKRVRIATPYFLPDASVTTALSMAAMNGVAVEIMMPQVNNLRLVQWGANALMGELLEHRCAVYFSEPPFDHTKLMLVDDDWASIGSANWDARSFRLNFEHDLECHDRALAAQLHTIFDQRLATATPLWLVQFRARALPVRLRDGAARVLSPYL